MGWMPFLKKPIQLQWTLHARAKMNHYRLSPARVRHVLHSPKRVEEGVAPKTVAMMQPVSMKLVGRKESWTQEIWVMVQDAAGRHTESDQRVALSGRHEAARRGIP